MWFLIIIAAMGAGVSGGVHASIETLEFTSREQCLEAAKTISKEGNVGSALISISGACVQK